MSRRTARSYAGCAGGYAMIAAAPDHRTARRPVHSVIKRFLHRAQEHEGSMSQYFSTEIGQPLRRSAFVPIRRRRLLHGDARRSWARCVPREAPARSGRLPLHSYDVLSYQRQSASQSRLGRGVQRLHASETCTQEVLPHRGHVGGQVGDTENRRLPCARDGQRRCLAGHGPAAPRA